MEEARAIFESVGPHNLHSYIRVGTASYREHYTHLWQNGDPSPYIESSFGEDNLRSALANPKNLHFIIFRDSKPVGILKLIDMQPVGTYRAEQALLLEKLYLLKAYSGCGIGVEALRYAETIGRRKNRAVLWLDTMQKGRALPFYLKNGYSVLMEKRLHYAAVLEEERPMFVLARALDG